MTPREALDSHRFLFLEWLAEAAEDSLTVVVAEGKVLDPPVHPLGRDSKIRARPVEVTPDSARYRIIFPDYVVYSVRDESYVDLDSSELFTGNVLRIFSKSRFMEFAAASTIASAEYPGPYIHYQLACCDHVIDVAALEAPTIEIEPAV